MVLIALSAWSEGGRVVVVDPDPRVLDAIDVALSPWSLRVLRVSGPLPPADVGAASVAVRSLADSERAGAVIWIASPAGGQPASLWVYDAQTEQLVVRPLSVAAPFDDAGAAAVALSVKTIMRGSPLVESSPSAQVGGAAAPAARTPQAETAAAAGPAKGAPAAAKPPETRPSAPRATPTRYGTAASTPVWRLEAVVGGRTPTGAAPAAQPQAALGVSAWPGSLRGHLGAGALVQAGPGATVENEAFKGQITQGDVVVTARGRAAAGRIAFELQAGPSLRLTSLDGAGIKTGLPVHAVRVNPALDTGAVFDVALGAHVAVGALLDVSVLLRFQHYALNGGTFFDEPPFDLLFGARLSAEVD